MGCIEPIGVKVLDLIVYQILVFQKLVSGGLASIPNVILMRIKLFAKLVPCKSTSTQLNNGQKTIGREKNYFLQVQKTSAIRSCWPYLFIMAPVKKQPWTWPKNYLNWVKTTW